MVMNPNLWVPRDEEGLNDGIPNYTRPEYFTVNVYHGGCLQGSSYVGGRYDFYDHCDKDMMSLVEVKNMVKQLSLFYETQHIEYWYRVGVEDGELVKLQTDEDVVHMCSSVPHWRLLIVYCDQLELHPDFRQEDDDDAFLQDILFSQVASCGVFPEEPSLGRSKGVVIRDVEQTVPTQASTIQPQVGPKDKGKQKVAEQEIGKKKKFVDFNRSQNHTSSGGIGCSSVQANEGDDLLDVQIDFMDQLQSYGGCELESENERSDEEDEDIRYDPAEEDDEYYQYGRDDDADNEEKATAAVSKKRKLNIEEGQAAQTQPKQRKPPMTKNELRQKIKQRNEYMRLRKAELKASKLDACKAAPNRTRPVQAASTQQSSRALGSAPTISRSVQDPNASTNKAASLRTSERIRQNSGKGAGK